MTTFKNPTNDLFERWHPYWKWEEVSHNMWGSARDRQSWLQRAIYFTGDHELYGAWMLKVADHWQHSCEQHLTKAGTGRKAWIGHAAVAMAMQCPEDIVRQAWGFLSPTQQHLANKKAQEAINYWINKYA